MRLVMLLTSGVSYLVNEPWPDAKYRNADEMNFEHPLTMLVWLTSVISIATTYLVSYLLIADLGDARSGGSSPRSSPAARSPARSSPN